MLTISKPLSAGQAQSYHQKEFTAKEQNYWSQRGVIAGEWQGRLAAQLGLAGAVSAEDFAKAQPGAAPGDRRTTCSPASILRVPRCRRKDRQDNGASGRMGRYIFRPKVRFVDGSRRRR